MTGLPGFHVAIERGPEGVRLTITGDVDLAAIPALERARNTALDGQPGKLLVDLSGVDFVDSSGLKFLLQTERVARDRGCAISLLRPTGHAMRVFVVTGADRYLPFLDADESQLSRPIS
jgi:anti-sigma B factor antagonist